MATISSSAFQALTDSMAAQIAAISEKMGTGTEAGSASLGGENNVSRVLATADQEVVEALLRYFRKGSLKKRTDPNGHVLFETEVKGLSFHVSGINNFCALNSVRVAPEFAEIHLRSIGVQVSPANVFPPEVANMADFSVTAPGVGVFTDRDAIDKTKYGPAHLKVRAVSNIGASAINATVSLLKFDGTAASKVVTIPASSPAGTEIDIGLTTDKYVDVTGITITGGTAGESFRVKAPRERALAL